MYTINVRGGKQLKGNVKISGAKNAVLPIIAASILGSDGESVIHDTPPLEDVRTMREVLSSLGIQITYEAGSIRVNAEQIQSCEASYEWVQKMRASFLVMGPLLARKGLAKIAFPGGCAIGTRPIDQHLKGFEAMGVEMDIGQGCIEARVRGKLKGAKIYLDVASVGATENIMMAAACAEGTTIIENAAKEPEIVDLANFINAMGGHIRGAGTGVIRIQGVERLQGAVHTVIPDRIEAGTYMIAAAITGGDVYVDGAIGDHLRPVVAKLEEMGVKVEEDEGGIRVKSTAPLRSVDVKTLPYPGFPTDMQSPMMALLATVEGTSVVTETVFENRFMHVDELIRMGANIQVEGRTAIVKGGSPLKAAKVCATDLRAGAALIIAALAAEGVTRIEGVHHIDRGYVDIEEKLCMLGADIERVRKETKQEKVAEEKAYDLLPVQPTWA